MLNNVVDNSFIINDLDYNLCHRIVKILLYNLQPLKLKFGFLKIYYA